MNSLGKRLRHARERKNLKQTQVKAKTGIHNKTLSGYENDVAEPDLQTLNILADLYETDINWLTGRVQMTTNDKSNNFIESYNRLPQHKQKLVSDLVYSLLDEKIDKLD
jgi:transcriptional regulator with XRE-family HTH domain